MPVRTLTELFQRGVHEHGPRRGLRYRRDGDWHPITYAQLGRLVEDAAHGLIDAGVEPGDVVTILAHNGPQVAIADLATLQAGATVLPLAPSRPREEVRSLLAETQPTALVLAPGLEPPWEKPPAAASLVVDLEAEPGREEAEPSSSSSASGVVRLTMTELYRRGQAHAREGADLEARLQAIEPDDVAHLAATGEGELRRCSHAGLVREARVLAGLADLAPGERSLSLLPLADPLHRAGGHYACFARGSEVWLAGDVERLPSDLTECRPELLVAPPAAYAAAWADLAERLERSPASQRSLFDWARAIGEARASARRSAEGVGLRLRARHFFADRLVLGKARAAMGLEHLRVAFSPGPVDREAAEGLQAIGVPLRESYAPDAVGGLVALERPDDPREASRGEPLPGVELRIDGDGEGGIEVRGPSLGQDAGWLATGDRGRLADGHLVKPEAEQDPKP